MQNIFYFKSLIEEVALLQHKQTSSFTCSRAEHCVTAVQEYRCCTNGQPIPGAVSYRDLGIESRYCACRIFSDENFHSNKTDGCQTGLDLILRNENLVDSMVLCLGLNALDGKDMFVLVSEFIVFCGTTTGHKYAKFRWNFERRHDWFVQAHFESV